jgi:hypothetical protein
VGAEDNEIYASHDDIFRIAAGPEEEILLALFYVSCKADNGLL